MLMKLKKQYRVIMQFISLEKKPMLDFIYGSIDEYADNLIEFGEFTSPEMAKASAKKEVIALIPDFTRQPHHRIYQLRENDLCVGHLWYILHTNPGANPHAFLAYVGIKPEHRRKGYANKAMQLYEQEVKKEHECTSSVFFVFCGNDPAIALYKKLGYKIVDSGTFNQATSATRFKMTKQLLV
jgi:ribosomal protein S18 acetylase RimI-like enzyme